jgi:hypothetical protein
METAGQDFTDWLEQADIPARRLTPQVEALLRAVFRFRQEALIPVIDEFNAQAHRLPWLHNRRVVVSLTPQPRPG